MTFVGYGCGLQRRQHLDRAFSQNTQELTEEVSLLRELRSIESQLKKAREHTVRGADPAFSSLLLSCFRTVSAAASVRGGGAARHPG